MRALKTIRLRLRSLLRGSRVEQELDEELRDHLEREVERRVAAGQPEDEARAAARRAFGNVPLIQEQVRDTRRVGWIEDLGRDVTYALRSMRKAPAYTAVAALSLAAAIGASTATFSIAHTLMLRDLPVDGPAQLVELAQRTPAGFGNFSYPLYQRLRDENTSFSHLLAVSSPVFRSDDGSDAPPAGRYVSGNFFDTLGLQPALGRLLTPADDEPSTNGSPVVVIGYGLWQRKFGGDPGVLGQRLELGNPFVGTKAPFTIVGVLPREFRGLTVGRLDEFYAPLNSERRVSPRSLLSNPGAGWLNLVGRRKDGVTAATAAADATLVYQRFVDGFAGMASPEEIRRRRDVPVVASSARAGLAGPRREFERPVLLLGGAVALVLLVAIANVVNLLLARGLGRRAEVSMRLAIGASRGRLVRQFLTEAAVLGLAGGALGLAVAVWGTPGVAALMANEDPAIVYDVRPDRVVLAFTILLSLGSAIVAGLLPALRVSRARAPSLRVDTGAGRGGRVMTIWSRGLVAGQVGLSLLLLIGAFLLIGTLRNFRTGSFAFERDGVVTMALSPARNAYAGERRDAYFRDVLERAAVALGLPMVSTGVSSSIVIEGQPADPDASVFVNEVSEDYFATTGTRLVLGRDFGPDDRRGSPPVAIVNEALARRYFPGVNPIGRRVTVGVLSRTAAPGSGGPLEIVGVVETTKHESLREPDSPIVYGHALQGGNLGGSLHLAVKTTGDPSAAGRTLRREIQRLAPVPVGQPSTLAALIDRTLVTERLVARVLGAFALVALVLAAVGLYGLLAYSVSRRTSEIGVRLALGATRQGVLTPVLAESLKLTALGVAAGVPASLALTRLLEKLLYGVTPGDWRVLGGIALGLLGVAVLAAAVPAWRASRIDPLTALRSE